MQGAGVDPDAGRGEVKITMMVSVNGRPVGTAHQDPEAFARQPTGSMSFSLTTI